MEYRRFPLACECGGAPKLIAAVGFTADREIVIHWRCARCGRKQCTVRPLLEAWSECFGGRAGVVPDTPEDLRFLHSIGVRYADD